MSLSYKVTETIEQNNKNAQNCVPKVVICIFNCNFAKLFLVPSV